MEGTMEGIPVRQTAEKGFWTLWVIWVAMLGSLLIYVFICHQLGDELRKNLRQDVPLDPLRIILYSATIFEMIFIVFLRKRILAAGGAVPEPMSPPPPEPSNQSSALAKYTTAVIISLALCESIGIYGLLLFFLGDTFQTLYIFIGIAALGMLFYRPKREEVETLAAAMQRKLTATPKF